jgi:DNA-binding transcriptional ArsR family regulator
METKELEKVLKALANRRRMAIVRLLKEKPEITVKDIASSIKLSIKATSKYLGILYASNIVDREQRSLLVFYRLSSNMKPETKKIADLL